MRYSIDEAITLIRRWKASQSIMRVTFVDVAAGGSFFGLFIDSPDASAPNEMPACFPLKILLPNGISGTSTIDVHLWGTEEIEFTDFTDEPPSPIPSDAMDRVTSCLAITYETGANASICEAWPDSRLDTMRATSDDLSAALLAQVRKQT